jgi:hypothetical protein
MINVKIKTDKNLRLNIPVPYAILHVGSSILSSEFLLRKLTKWANHHARHKTPISFMPLSSKSSKQLFKELIRDLHHHKGLVVVDVKLQDGTEVVVRL